MTSATGNKGNKHLARRAAFTLIEIVLVIGLIAIASTIVIVNISSFIGRDDSLNTEESLTAAIRKARFLAASDRSPTALSFDKETGSLVVDGERSEAIRYPLAADYGQGGSAEIKFYLVPSTQGLSPAPDPLRTQLETKKIQFAPDRSATPFVVEIDNGTGSPERHAYDPFSSLRRAAKP